MADVAPTMAAVAVDYGCRLDLNGDKDERKILSRPPPMRAVVAAVRKFCEPNKKKNFFFLLCQ